MNLLTLFRGIAQAVSKPSKQYFILDVSNFNSLPTISSYGDDIILMAVLSPCTAPFTKCSFVSRFGVDSEHHGTKHVKRTPIRVGVEDLFSSLED